MLKSQLFASFSIAMAVGAFAQSPTTGAGTVPGQNEQDAKAVRALLAHGFDDGGFDAALDTLSGFRPKIRTSVSRVGGANPASAHAAAVYWITPHAIRLPALPVFWVRVVASGLFGVY